MTSRSSPCAQLEPLAGISALEHHRKQDQGGEAYVRRVVGIDPAQGSERQVEDVDALLLLDRACVEVELEQALLQALRRQAGLQPGVRVSAEHAAVVRDVVLGLSEIRYLLDLVVLESRRLRFVTRPCRLSGEEGEHPALPHEHPEDLRAHLVDDLDRARALR